MDKYICGCCGGRINRSTMTCEYCGTQYKEENNNIIRIETFRNPVRTFQAKVAIPDSWFREFDAEEVSKMAVKELANELAKAIPPMMEVYQEYDPSYMQHILKGRIKIVQPVNGGKINGPD